MVDLHAALFKIGASYYQPLVYESKIGINIKIHSDKSALNDFCLEWSEYNHSLASKSLSTSKSIISYLGVIK